MNQQKTSTVVNHAIDRILQMKLIEVNRVRLEAIIEQVVDDTLDLKGGTPIDILKNRSAAYVEVFSALNDIYPDWENGQQPTGEAAANFIRELAKKASEPKADNYLKSQSEAWMSVVKALDEVYPDWNSKRHLSCDKAAIAAIRKLARKAKKKAKKALLRTQQVEQITLVLDWDKAPDWATRVCSTPTGCLLYADDKHYASFAHPESRYEINAVGDWEESQLEVIGTRPAPKVISEAPIDTFPMFSDF